MEVIFLKSRFKKGKPKIYILEGQEALAWINRHLPCKAPLRREIIIDEEDEN